MMKYIVQVALLAFLSYPQSHAQDFITIWDLSLYESSIDMIRFEARLDGIIRYRWEVIGDTTQGSGYFFGSGSFLKSEYVLGLPPEQKIRLIIEPDNFQQFRPYGTFGDLLIDVENWGEVQWTSMEGTFASCINLLDFSADDVPDLSLVTNMSRMFYGASAFNGFIGHWDVSQVTDMSWMFYSASAFNGNIGSWDVSQVTKMTAMFDHAVSFDQDISEWDVHNVEDMSWMFIHAHDFNQDLSNWDVSKVEYMDAMFSRATSFDQDLGNWETDYVMSMYLMLDKSGMSCEKYSKTLSGWVENPAIPFNVILGAYKMEYSSDTKYARDVLTGQKNWTIEGDTMVEDCFTSIDETQTEGNRSTVFPNPSSGHITLIAGHPSSVRGTIYDLTGRHILDLPTFEQTTRIDLTGRPGTYLIKLLYDTGDTEYMKCTIIH